MDKLQETRERMDRALTSYKGVRLNPDEIDEILTELRRLDQIDADYIAGKTLVR